MSSRKFLILTSLLGLLTLVFLMFAPSEKMAQVLIFIAGLGIANIFPLIFSLTVGQYPLRANEISGLMIMAVSGGAIIPPLMGWLGDTIGVQASVFVLVFSIGLILIISLFSKTTEHIDR